MSDIQLSVCCTVSFGQLTVQCCKQTLCFGFHFALQFVTFNFQLRYVYHSVGLQLHCHLPVLILQKVSIMLW